MRTGRKTIHVERDELVRLYDECKSWTEVARRLGVTVRTVHVLRAKYGLKARNEYVSLARSSVSKDYDWMRDKDAFLDYVRKYGSLNGLARETGISITALRYTARKFGIRPGDYMPDLYSYGVRRYDEIHVLEGDWVVAGDFHIPYVDEKMLSLVVEYGQAWGISKLLMAGDVLDFDQFSKFDPVTEPVGWGVTQEITRKVFSILGDAFGEIVWMLGNHELRISRLTKGAWGLLEVVRVVNEKGVKAIVAPRVRVSSGGVNYDIIHPRSYSSLPLSVAADMASKYNSSVLCFHSHKVGYRRDRSGVYRVYDIGCMADPNKIGYVNLQPVRYPNMNQGFAIVKGGFVWMIEPDSDHESLLKLGGGCEQ